MWKKVIFAADLKACDCCDDLICSECDNHYADCECPGPTMDYEYKEIDGVLHALV